IIEPGTDSKGIIEGALRDYGLVGGLIEATDLPALRSLDVILLGILYRTSGAMMRAIRDAVAEGGVGLLNEFWTGSGAGESCGDPAVRDLMLAAGPLYEYHTPGKCGTFQPARVLRDHAIIAHLSAGTRLQVRGCGPAYEPRPQAVCLIAQEQVV